MGNFSPPYSAAIKTFFSLSLPLLSWLVAIAKQTKLFAIVSSIPAEINTRVWLEPIVCSSGFMSEANLAVYPLQGKLVIIYQKLELFQPF